MYMIIKLGVSAANYSPEVQIIKQKGWWENSATW